MDKLDEILEDEVDLSQAVVLLGNTITQTRADLNAALKQLKDMGTVIPPEVQIKIDAAWDQAEKNKKAVHELLGDAAPTDVPPANPADPPVEPDEIEDGAKRG